MELNSGRGWPGRCGLLGLGATNSPAPWGQLRLWPGTGPPGVQEGDGAARSRPSQPRAAAALGWREAGDQAAALPSGRRDPVVGRAPGGPRRPQQQEARTRLGAGLFRRWLKKPSAGTETTGRRCFQISRKPHERRLGGGAGLGLDSVEGGAEREARSRAARRGEQAAVPPTPAPPPTPTPHGVLGATLLRGWGRCCHKDTVLSTLRFRRVCLGLGWGDGEPCPGVSLGLPRWPPECSLTKDEGRQHKETPFYQLAFH